MFRLTGRAGNAGWSQGNGGSRVGVLQSMGLVSQRALVVKEFTLRLGLCCWRSGYPGVAKKGNTASKCKCVGRAYWVNYHGRVSRSQGQPTTVCTRPARFAHSWTGVQGLAWFLSQIGFRPTALRVRVIRNVRTHVKQGVLRSLRQRRRRTPRARFSGDQEKRCMRARRVLVPMQKERETALPHFRCGLWYKRGVW